MQSYPSVTCIILNWNGSRHTVPCLERLLHSEYPNLTILVVDNGSTDDSVAQIRSAFPAQAILQTGKNLGFGAGNNRGIAQALADGAEYIWLLNNDTLVQPDTLSAMMTMAREEPRLGQIGSVLLYADRPNEVQAWGGGKVNLWTGRITHFRAPVPETELQYITAASLLMPAVAVQQVGGFDEAYFMYFEDTDLSLRTRARGWRLGVCERSRVLHAENGSSVVKSASFDHLVTDSGLTFLRRYSPWPSFTLIWFVGGRALKRLIRRRKANAFSILTTWWQKPASRAYHQPQQAVKR